MILKKTIPIFELREQLKDERFFRKADEKLTQKRELAKLKLEKKAHIRKLIENMSRAEFEKKMSEYRRSMDTGEITRKDYLRLRSKYEEEYKINLKATVRELNAELSYIQKGKYRYLVDLAGFGKYWVNEETLLKPGYVEKMLKRLRNKINKHKTDYKSEKQRKYLKRLADVVELHQDIEIKDRPIESVINELQSKNIDSTFIIAAIEIFSGDLYGEIQIYFKSI